MEKRENCNRKKEWGGGDVGEEEENESKRQIEN